MASPVVSFMGTFLCSNQQGVEDLAHGLAIKDQVITCMHDDHIMMMQVRKMLYIALSGVGSS